MSTTLNHQIVRIQLLTNGNFGAASGRVTLDRPTQLDAYLGLPFIPNSSLRGVIRNFWETIPSPPVDTEKAFGTRREEEKETEERKENQPGNFIIGNGDLLAFSVSTAEGERCWIVVMHTVCKYIRLGELSDNSFSEYDNILQLAQAIYNLSGKIHPVVGLPRIPDLSLPYSLDQIAAPDFKDVIKSFLALLEYWVGDWLPKNETLLVVDEDIARYLWQREAEIRDMTALTKKKIAKPQSLRRIETIPEGSLFLSFISGYGSPPISHRIDGIQFGSGEGVGLGFCRLASLKGDGPNDMKIPSFDTEEVSGSVAEFKIMGEVFNAVYKAENSISRMDEDFRKKVRSAVRMFGWRMTDEGLTAAIAFALAKAKPYAKSRGENDEKEVYRWVLKVVLNDNGDLKKYKGKPWFTEDFKPQDKQLVYLRWKWLSKFSESNFKEV